MKPDERAISEAGATLRAARRDSGVVRPRSERLFDAMPEPVHAATRARRDGAALRDEGVERAARAAGQEWQDAAIGWVRSYAFHHAEFTCDEVREFAESMGLRVTREPRAWGAVMQRAQREGIAYPTPAFRASTRPACHRCPKRIWRRV